MCYGSSSNNWSGLSPDGGDLDAALANYRPWAHSGKSLGWLGSIINADELSGILTPANPLNTKPGVSYTITFFHASAYSGQTDEANSFVDIMWNNHVVTTIRPGFSDWAYHEFPVTANGNDVLAFHGGLPPAFSWIDDVYVFEA